MRKIISSLVLVVFLAGVLMTGAGCSSGARKGAAVGAVAGGAVGAVIGHATGSTARGAIIGAVVGGAAGAIIGREMDKQAEELEQDIPGATVQRIGEGIAVTFASGLLFDFDSDVLRAESRRNLDALADNLHKYKERDLLIVGHADATGTRSYNQDLSERRAASVARYLRLRGVPGVIEAVGRGEDEPIASNETEDGRQLNRRVEVAIYASEDLKEAARREVATTR